MSMPSKLRAMNVGLLQQHAKKEFGVELVGTKPALLAKLKELYAERDAKKAVVPAESGQEAAKSGADDALDDVRMPSPATTHPEAASADEKEPPKKAAVAAKSTPKPKESGAARYTMNTPTREPHRIDDLVPEVVPYHGARISRWPEKVQWLFNPANGRRFRATPALRSRTDLVPCTPPLPPEEE